MGNQKIIVVLGPTASGKSDLAVHIAKLIIKNRKRFHIAGAEIISADSRQVYKGLDLGSGKVPNQLKAKSKKLKEYRYRNISHHLLDVASPKKTFTVSQYQKLGSKIIKKLHKENKIPIICGGTGFYIDSLIYNYKFPAVKPNLKLRKELEKQSSEQIFKVLEKLDPHKAKNTDKNNKRRMIRAIEIIKETKKPISPLPKIMTYDIVILGIKKEKEELKKLIEKRLQKRLDQGMIKEVLNLHKKEKISWKRLESLGLEYRFIAQFLQNKISQKEMEEKIIKGSLNYSKRQMTWWKGNQSIKWVLSVKKAPRLIESFLKA